MLLSHSLAAYNPLALVENSLVDPQDDVRLASALAFNGGVTPLALEPGSVAVDVITTNCNNDWADPSGTVVDQRGIRRPQSAACDARGEGEE